MFVKLIHHMSATVGSLVLLTLLKCNLTNTILIYSISFYEHRMYCGHFACRYVQVRPQLEEYW